MEKSEHHITRRAVLGATIASVSALASPTCYAAGGNHSSGKEESEWLREHLVAIRSIEPADETYDDLEPIVGAIGAARLVLLGESSHGSGSDFKAKVRLINFLYRRMGFDVIVWESGFHAMDQVNAALRSTADPVAAAKRGIFTIWSNSKEVEPLFKLVQSSWAGRRPIEMAGFDAQITAQGAEQLLFDEMRQFAGSCPDAGLRQAVTADVERAISAYKEIGGPSGSAESVANAGRAIDGIIQVIDRHGGLFESTHSRRGLSSMKRALENFRCFAELRFEASQGTPGTTGVQLKDPTGFFNRRDEENARNIRWLLDDGYPGRKIIVWAHNVHIIKAGFGSNFGPLTQHPSGAGMTPMGKMIAGWLRDGCYAVGFTSYEGEDSWVTAPKANPIPIAPADSLEAHLHNIGRPYGFIDLRGHKPWGGDITEQRIFVPAPGNVSNTPDGIFSVSKQPGIFDGIFFIDRMMPATPIAAR